MIVYYQPTFPYFYYHWKGLKKMNLGTHIADHEELSAVFQQHIDKLKAGELTPEQLENLKNWCVLGFQLKDEIATDQWVKVYEFRDRLEGIFRVTESHKEVTPFKKKIEALVRETWD